MMRLFLVCRNEKCPYWLEGFCGKDSIAIDEMGMCNVVWKKGKPREVKPYWNDDGVFVREKLNIIQEEVGIKEKLEEAADAIKEKVNEAVAG